MGGRAADPRRPDVSPQVRNHRHQTAQTRPHPGGKARTRRPGWRTRLALLHHLCARYPRTHGAARGGAARPTVSVREARPGITIAMVTDPDGNTVEFLQNSASK